MKELVKPNSLENSYQEAKQFCESGYESSCTINLCIGRRARDIDEEEDILF